MYKELWTGTQKYYRVLLLFYIKTIPPSEPLIESQTSKEKDKEKIFVNDKIAAFENRTGFESLTGTQKYYRVLLFTAKPFCAGNL